MAARHGDIDVAFRPVRDRGRSARRPPILAAALPPGERVVALGGHFLHEGERVRFASDPGGRAMSGFNLSALAVRERAVTLFLIVAITLAGIFAFLQAGPRRGPGLHGQGADRHRRLARRHRRRRCRIWSPSRWRSACRNCAGTTASRPSPVPAWPLMMLTLKDNTPPREVPEQFYQARKKLGDEARNLPQGALGPFVNDEYSDVTFALYA